MSTPRNILIARLSSIGDIILTTPLIRAVRKAFPDAKVTFLVKREFASLVRSNPYLDEVIEFEKSGGLTALLLLRKTIRKNRYDLFIDLHQNLRTRFLRYTISFPLTTSYSKQTLRRHLLVRFGSNRMKEARPIFLKYFDALERFNISYDGLGTEVFVSEEILTEIRTRVNTVFGTGTSPLVVLCPGASFTNKQWLPERFAEVADSLSRESKANIVFLGGKGDRDLCESIRQSMRYKALNLAGELPLPASAALLKHAIVVITNDSGMMHLAQSQKTPVVAIFGPTTKELGFFPLPDSSHVVEKKVACRPCTTKGLNHCPKKHFRCMTEISPDQVLKAAVSFLPPQIP